MESRSAAQSHTGLLPRFALWEPLELTAGKSFFSLWIVASILETSQDFIGSLLFWTWRDRERIFIVWGRKKNRKWSHLLWNLKPHVECSNHFSQIRVLSLFTWTLQAHVGRRVVHVFRPKLLFFWNEELSRGQNSKESASQCRRRRRSRFDPWAGKVPWRRKWQPPTVFLPGESHGRGAWRATVCRVANSHTRLSMHTLREKFWSKQDLSKTQHLNKNT